MVIWLKPSSIPRINNLHSCILYFTFYIYKHSQTIGIDLWKQGICRAGDGTSKLLGCKPKTGNAHSIPQSREDQSKTKSNTGKIQPTDIKSTIINDIATASWWALDKILRNTEMMLKLVLKPSVSLRLSLNHQHKGKDHHNEINVSLRRGHTHDYPQLQKKDQSIKGNTLLRHALHEVLSCFWKRYEIQAEKFLFRVVMVGLPAITR